MFICKECSGKHFDNHFGFSFGPCESCKKTKPTADCHCSFTPEKKNKVTKKGVKKMSTPKKKKSAPKKPTSKQLIEKIGLKLEELEEVYSEMSEYVDRMSTAVYEAENSRDNLTDEIRDAQELLDELEESLDEQTKT